jgi:hypothetical protein
MIKEFDSVINYDIKYRKRGEKMKQSDRYLKIVEWSEDDQCYIDSAPGLIYGGVHGDNEIEVYKELIEAVEYAITIYAQDNKPLPAPTIPNIYKQDSGIVMQYAF